MNTSLASAAPVFPQTSPASSTASNSSATKPLWAAVGVLGVCVLAMGATLVHVNQRPEPLAQASIPFASAQASMPTAPNALLPASASKSAEKFEEIISPAPTKSAPTAPKSVATRAPAPSAASAPSVASQEPATTPAPIPAPAKSVCASCGTVEAVTAFSREGKGSGVGMIAGGVLGGVVGNQIGNGNGRAAATVLGAIGGGYAGNTVEKNMKKTTAYNVRVRMQDGSSRTVEQSSAPLVGSKVTLDGNVLRPA